MFRLFTNVTVDERIEILEEKAFKGDWFNNSPADKWNDCAFDDLKRMKLGTHGKHIQQSILSYRAISDWSRDP